MIDNLLLGLKNSALVIFIALLAVVLAKFLRVAMSKFVKRASNSLKVDPTRYKFLKNTITFVVYGAATTLIIYTIPSLRALSLTLFAGAGIFAAILGFASQQAFSNIISGIFIVIFKPFRVDDLIKIGDQVSGIVEDITLRHTVIRDFKNRRIIIPNSVISAETVINSNIKDAKSCEHFQVGIGYKSDIDTAIKIIQEEAFRHPHFFDNRTPEEKKRNTIRVEVRVIELGEYAVTLRAYLWADDPFKAKEMLWDLNKTVKERFDQEGIEIPFPYRNVIVHKDSL